MDATERRRLKEMAVNAMTGHLNTHGEDPLYLLGQSLERALEEVSRREECDRCDLCATHEP